MPLPQIRPPSHIPTLQLASMSTRSVFKEVSWSSPDEVFEAAMREAGSENGVLLINDQPSAPFESIRALFDIAYTNPEVRRGGGSWACPRQEVIGVNRLAVTPESCTGSCMLNMRLLAAESCTTEPRLVAQ